jgi:integrase
MNAILDRMRAEANEGSIHALRDYAVTLLYLYSGLRRNEIIELRGGDVELRKGVLIVRSKLKGGKYQTREVAQVEVRKALLAYLKKSKRLSVLHTKELLWARHDRAGAPGLQLTSRSYTNNLKKYAAKAGVRRVNIHQTPHTFETQSALDHESQATTRAYVHRVTLKTDKHNDSIARRFGRRRTVK